SSGNWSAVNQSGPNLHKIRFAAGWPGSCADVASKGPKSWPKALVGCAGELDAGLDPAVLKILQALSLHASRIPSAALGWSYLSAAAAAAAATPGRSARKGQASD